MAPQPPTAVEAERPKPEKPREALLLERGAILLPQGTLQIEPSLDYTHFSSNRVTISGFTLFNAIVIGTIEVDKLDVDLMTPAVTLRYGLLDRLQLETRIPYVWREDREILAVGTADAQERTTSTGPRLGDLEASVLGQALIGEGVIPDVLLRMRGRFPTGTNPFEIETEDVRVGAAGAPVKRLKEPPTGNGFQSVAPGITLVWRSDPVVFFAGANYSFNLKREFLKEDGASGDFGKIDPGDTLEFFFGLNIALSERVSVNMSFTDSITESTTQTPPNRTETTVVGTSSNDARLILGASVALWQNGLLGSSGALTVSAGAGLTRDSPDFAITFALPITFKPF
ncbi:MAG: hypothetical protein WAP47_14995 [Candidatus Rokuibacteriota bacterium]